MLTLTPYFFYPLYLVKKGRMCALSYSKINHCIRDYEYRYHENSYVYYSLFEIIAKIISVPFDSIVIRLRMLCQL